MSSSSFFDLCPDILLDIFIYFSLNELFNVFIDLIPSLSILLNQSHIKLHIDKNTNEDFWNGILPQINLYQIISLNNSYPTINLSEFTSLRLMNINLQSSSLFYQFQYLIYLEQLSLVLSQTIIEEDIWLYYILPLPNLKKLKLDLAIPKNIFILQKDISISESILQSNTIKYLEIKIPMSLQSLLVFLNHFPNLKIFRASLYRLNSSENDLLTSIGKLTSLQVLDLHGYFHKMSSMVAYISSSMPNLKRCRLIAMNVTNDNAFRMRDGRMWKYLFDCCSHLIQVKIHLLMSVEENHDFNVRVMKDFIRAFNNNSFCEEHHFQMEQRSLNRGYVTLTGDYEIKKTKF